MSSVDPTDLELYRNGRRERIATPRRGRRSMTSFIAIRESWDLMVHIAGLPGPALIVYLHLRRLWTMSGRRSVTELAWGGLRAVKISGRTLRRGLEKLEAHGIVVVYRRHGRKSTFSFVSDATMPLPEQTSAAGRQAP